MVRLIHEVLMEGNCYSWLHRLMNTVSFSQHHMLKIQGGQVMPGSSRPPRDWCPHGPGVTRHRNPLEGTHHWGWGHRVGHGLGQKGEDECVGVEGKMLLSCQKFFPL